VRSCCGKASPAIHIRRAAGYQVITGHARGVDAVAAGALPDGTSVIISGGDTVQMWRAADGAPLVPPLDQPNQYTCCCSRQRHHHCGRPTLPSTGSAPAALALAVVSRNNGRQ
jgi:hypothetical protein